MLAQREKIVLGLTECVELALGESGERVRWVVMVAGQSVLRADTRRSRTDFFH